MGPIRDGFSTGRRTRQPHGLCECPPQMSNASCMHVIATSKQKRGSNASTSCPSCDVRRGYPHHRCECQEFEQCGACTEAKMKRAHSKRRVVVFDDDCCARPLSTVIKNVTSTEERRRKTLDGSEFGAKLNISRASHGDAITCTHSPVVGAK
jgi:hypothetical protein